MVITKRLFGGFLKLAGELLKSWEEIYNILAGDVMCLYFNWSLAQTVQALQDHGTVWESQQARPGNVV